MEEVNDHRGTHRESATFGIFAKETKYFSVEFESRQVARGEIREISKSS